MTRDMRMRPRPRQHRTPAQHDLTAGERKLLRRLLQHLQDQPGTGRHTQPEDSRE